MGKLTFRLAGLRAKWITWIVSDEFMRSQVSSVENQPIPRQYEIGKYWPTRHYLSAGFHLCPCTAEVLAKARRFPSFLGA